MYFFNEDNIKLAEDMIKEPGCILLKGSKGIGKYALARHLTEKLLIGKIEGNPDFLQVTSSNDVIKLEDISPIKRAVCTYAQGKCKVFIIDDANLMTREAQNSLLKLLEDGIGENVIILVAHDLLLPTIESRCKIVHVTAPALRKNLIEHGENIDELSLAIAGNRPGVYYSLKTKRGYLISISNFLPYLAKRDMEGMLRSLSLLKEKDPNHFFEKNQRSDVFEFVLLIADIIGECAIRHLKGMCHEEYNNIIDFSQLKENFSLEECFDLRNEILSHVKAILTKQYSKNDFFDFVRLFQ